MISWFENRINPYPEAAPRPLPGRLLPFLWACAQGVRLPLFALAVSTAVIGAFEALLFSMLGHLVDWVGRWPASELLTREHDHFVALSVILALSPIGIAVQALVKHQTIAAAYPMRLRWNFHRTMLGQSMRFYQEEFAGRVAAKVMQTALAVRDTWLIAAEMLVYVAIYFATILGVVAEFNATMALPFAAWMIGYALTCCYFVPRLARMSSAQADARSLMTGRVTDAYTNISTVKLFSHGHREAQFAREAMREFMVTAHGQMRLVSGFEIINHLLSIALVAATAALGISLWTRSAIGIGALAAGTAMALRLNGISHWIMWEMATLFENVGTVQDGLNTLSKAVAVIDSPDARPLAVSRGEIRFEDVTFTYGGKRAVIDQLTLNIRPGERIGLVGRSGAGKSTIVNLLLRFYDLDAGRILIDGQDISTVTQESLRESIGMVTQDTSLLHRSVRDNILYGRPDASDDAMRQAAQDAHAHDFIEPLSDAQGRRGYDAHVGERGVKLSGGQRQRIAIARVMVKNAPILLLDEATSALDSEVELAIQETLADLMKGKTVVAIAHRLSTIAAMDRLIVLDAGRVVEEGTHAELLAKGGLYARLWEHQSGGFLGTDDEALAA